MGSTSQDVQALATLVLGFSELAVREHELGAVKIPIHAIVGSEDPNVQQVRDLGRLIPDARVTVIQGATHWVESGVLVHSEFVDSVRAFLAEYGNAQ